MSDVYKEALKIVQNMKNEYLKGIIVVGYNDLKEAVREYHDLYDFIYDIEPLAIEIDKISFIDNCARFYIVNALGDPRMYKVNYLLTVYFEDDYVTDIKVQDVYGNDIKQLDTFDVLTIYKIISDIEGYGPKEYLIQLVDAYFG